MRFSPCAAPFRSLFVRRRPFTLSDAKLTFCAQCAIIVGPVPFNKIARQRILQSPTTNSIRHDNKNNRNNMITFIGREVVPVVSVVVQKRKHDNVNNDDNFALLFMLSCFISDGHGATFLCCLQGGVRRGRVEGGQWSSLFP